jgi:DNA-binding transcriptional ArsR family regulator
MSPETATVTVTVTSEEIFSILSDRISTNIIKSAYSGLRASSNYLGKISKKQFYVRLKRLREAGLIEKRDNFYGTTTLGSLIYNGHIKTLEEALANFWQLKAIDVLKTRNDFPSHQKEIVIDENH